MKKPLFLTVLLVSGLLNAKTITANLLIDTATTLSEHSVNSAGEGLSFNGFYRFDLGVLLSKTLTANMRLGYSQEYSYALPDQSTGDLADLRLGLTQSLGEIRKDLTIELSPRLYLPTSKESRRAGLQSAAGLAVIATQKWGAFTLQLAPRFVQYFHDVTVQWNGTPNTESTLACLIDLTYSLSDKWSLDVSFDPSHSWTYFGTTRDTYILAYEIDYDISDNMALGIGINNKASALKSNGLDYNYALWDQAQFMGYFDVNLKL